METLDVELVIKASDEKKGTFKGYGAVYNNLDLGRDIIVPGAFKKIKKTRSGHVRLALDHNLSRLVGKGTVTSDDKGLWLEGELDMELSYVPDVYRQIKSGLLDGLSVGFNILKDGVEWAEDYSQRTIKKAELWEISIVPFGMNPKAKIKQVKAATTIRDFESFLREEGGYSKKEAEALASHGFKAFRREPDNADRGDPGTASSERLAALKSDISTYWKI